MSLRRIEDNDLCNVQYAVTKKASLVNKLGSVFHRSGVKDNKIASQLSYVITAIKPEEIEEQDLSEVNERALLKDVQDQIQYMNTCINEVKEANSVKINDLSGDKVIEILMAVNNSMIFIKKAGDLKKAGARTLNTRLYINRCVNILSKQIARLTKASIRLVSGKDIETPIKSSRKLWKELSDRQGRVHGREFLEDAIKDHLKESIFKQSVMLYLENFVSDDISKLRRELGINSRTLNYMNVRTKANSKSLFINSISKAIEGKDGLKIKRRQLAAENIADNLYDDVEEIVAYVVDNQGASFDDTWIDDKLSSYVPLIVREWDVNLMK